MENVPCMVLPRQSDRPKLSRVQKSAGEGLVGSSQGPAWLGGWTVLRTFPFFLSFFCVRSFARSFSSFPTW